MELFSMVVLRYLVENVVAINIVIKVKDKVFQGLTIYKENALMFVYLISPVRLIMVGFHLIGLLILISIRMWINMGWMSPSSMWKL